MGGSWVGGEGVGGEPGTVDGISRGFGRVDIAEHDLAPGRTDTFGSEDTVGGQFGGRSVRAGNGHPSASICFKIIRHVLTETNVDATVERMLVDDLVNFAAVTIELLAVGHFLIPVLGRDVGAVPVLEDETLALVVDGIKGLFDPFPALEDAAGVGREADDVAESLQGGGFVEEGDVVAFAVTLDGCGEAGKPRANSEMGVKRVVFRIKGMLGVQMEKGRGEKGLLT